MMVKPRDLSKDVLVAIFEGMDFDQDFLVKLYKHDLAKQINKIIDQARQKADQIRTRGISQKRVQVLAKQLNQLHGLYDKKMAEYKRLGGETVSTVEETSKESRANTTRS